MVLSREQPPVWMAHFADGYVCHSGEATWDALGLWQEVGGVQVIQTHNPLVRLELLPRDIFGAWHTIFPPEPLPFFSFTRYASSPLVDEPLWLYTLFGYVLGDYRFTWKVLPDTFHEVTVSHHRTPIRL